MERYVYSDDHKVQTLEYTVKLKQQNIHHEDENSPNLKCTRNGETNCGHRK